MSCHAKRIYYKTHLSNKHCLEMRNISILIQTSPRQTPKAI